MLDLSSIILVFVIGEAGGESSWDLEEVLGMVFSTSEAIDVRIDVRVVDD